MLRDPITLGIAGLCAFTGVVVSIWQVRRGAGAGPLPRCRAAAARSRRRAPELTAPPRGGADPAAPAELHGAGLPGMPTAAPWRAPGGSPAARAAAARRRPAVGPLLPPGPARAGQGRGRQRGRRSARQQRAHAAPPGLDRAQRYIVRIIFMVPSYAIASWCSLMYRDSAIYFDTIRDWCVRAAPAPLRAGRRSGGSRARRLGRLRRRGGRRRAAGRPTAGRRPAAAQLRGVGHLQLPLAVHGVRGRPRRGGHQGGGRHRGAQLGLGHLLPAAHGGGRLLPAQVGPGPAPAGSCAPAPARSAARGPSRLPPRRPLWQPRSAPSGPARAPPRRLAACCAPRRCKQGTLQFVFMKPIMAAITLLLYAAGHYEDGDWSAEGG
jgi:hypothetical protein